MSSTTAGVLGKYRTELITQGFPSGVIDELVLDAARVIVQADQGLTVAEATDVDPVDPAPFTVGMFSRRSTTDERVEGPPVAANEKSTRTRRCNCCEECGCNCAI